MFSHGDAAVHVFSARAAASRANGARSKGPRTAEGKARAAQNALRHGMCAKKFLLLPDDSRAEFAAVESALLEELRPQGPLETLLARRLIAAAWRLARADRLEFEMLVGGDLQRSPGGALTRDGGAERAFATLVRYRNGAQAEFFRTLKALQARPPAAKAEASSGVDEAGRLPLRPPALPEDWPLRPGSRPGLNEAEPQPFVLPRDTSASRNEPERTATGHRCAEEATRNEPERPARTLRESSERPAFAAASGSPDALPDVASAGAPIQLCPA